MKELYTPEFYDKKEGWPADSHVIVVPFLNNLLKPKSVIDVGCGVGRWLGEFIAEGVDEVQGIDGPWVPRDKLCIPQYSFQEADFTKDLPAFPLICRAFDLALCLETAEHLPPEKAKELVGYLIELSHTVLFSAAVPGQGGVGHVNEQPPGYWINLFRERGYSFHDVIRPVYWNHPKVAPWYKQNMMIFSDRGYCFDMPSFHGFHLVHPEVFGNLSERFNSEQAKHDGQIPQGQDLPRNNESGEGHHSEGQPSHGSTTKWRDSADDEARFGE